MNGAADRWNKPVVIYGDDKLRKDHPVVAFLAKEGRCSSLSIYKDGYVHPLHTQTVHLRASAIC